MTRLLIGLILAVSTSAAALEPGDYTLGSGRCNAPTVGPDFTSYYCYGIPIFDETQAAIGTVNFYVEVAPDGTFAGGHVWGDDSAGAFDFTDWSGSGFSGDFTGGSLSVSVTSYGHWSGGSGRGGRRWVTSWEVPAGGLLGVQAAE